MKRNNKPAKRRTESSDNVPSKPFSVVVLVNNGRDQREEFVECGVNAQCLQDNFMTATIDATNDTRRDGCVRHVQLRQIVFGTTIVRTE